MAFLPTIEPGQNLGEFIAGVYNLAIGLVGLAVFIQFIRAGLTYLLAAGNAAEVNKGRDMMQNAILGAILLLSSYLILNVINPDLVNVNLFNLNEIKQQIRGTPTTSKAPSTTFNPGNQPPPN
ncbi:MAG: hypothetical protein AAB420_02120 [Patescibacteria group bacterium]